jgi:SAM-dependent methyltransferase
MADDSVGRASTPPAHAASEVGWRRVVGRTIVADVDPVVARNRAVWEEASQKHVRENQDLLDQARGKSSLAQCELDVLRPLLASAPVVVHLQSGHGLDDVHLVAAGARCTVGVDLSEVAAAAAQRRARALAVPCRYVAAEVPFVPLGDQCADLVYTGKGALIWMSDLGAWGHAAARLLRPGGHLFIFEAHPMVPLWTWEVDETRIRPDRSYFARSHSNDTYPARGATEWQWTLGQIITAVIAAGLEIRHLAEHPEPFWQPDGVTAAAWQGRLPNTYSLLARRRQPGA